jgi:hypothetical protein
MGFPITEVGYQSQYHNLGISPISLDVLLTSFLASGLVKGFANSFLTLQSPWTLYQSQ